MLFTAALFTLAPLLALAAPVSPRDETSSLTKRYRATYYQTGLGACGWYNQPSDFIVALNSAQFGSGYPGPNCGRSITISANGKQVQATIADQCPSCGYGELDLSEGLFTQFAGTGAGVFDMTWWYNSGSGSPGGGQPQQQPAPEPTTTHKPSPTPEYTPPPPPTSTYTPPAPTSTYTPPPPETSTAAPVQIQVASSSSSAAPSSSSPASSATQASATLLPSSSANGTTSDTATMMVGGSGINNATNLAQMGNLAMINAAVAQLGRIVVVGAGGH